MDFYPNEDSGPWSRARDEVASRNSFLLKTTPVLLAGPAGGNVSVALNLANDLYDAIEFQAKRGMDAIKHLKEQN